MRISWTRRSNSKFIQGDTVSEQVQAAESVRELLTDRNLDKRETIGNPEVTYDEKRITPAQAAENALRGSTTSIVNETERVERLALNPEKTNEGVSINDQ